MVGGKVSGVEVVYGLFTFLPIVEVRFEGLNLLLRLVARMLEGVKKLF